MQNDGNVENTHHKILIVIPARGGSKGIPRKNLRNLAGKPLIYYAITNALSSRYEPDVYVSSDDDEIILIAKKIGAKTLKRDKNKARDLVTLDPVIYDALNKITKLESVQYDLVVTLQPTSPLLKTFSLDTAIKYLIENVEVDTVISAVNDTHLTWKLSNNKYQPNYKKRVNRQELNPQYRETGGFLITRANVITENNRIGKTVDLHILDEIESIDIDTYSDWGLCEYFLKRKKILFVVSGNQEIGLGHVYNTLQIANDILEHELLFLVDWKSRLAYEKIASKNYYVVAQSHDSIHSDIDRINPDVVINDRLDTDENYVVTLKGKGYKVINFEDLGEGAKYSDLTINAIYPEEEELPNHYFGYKYFILRDEFMLSSHYKVRQEVRSVLLSFGGVDPNNYTVKVLESIYETAKKANVKITVILGFGYQQHDSLLKFRDNISIFKNVQNISDYMKNSDIVISSAGRTIYEIASLGVPAIILAQNKRELTHFFAEEDYGFINLGLGTEVSREEISFAFEDLVRDAGKRKRMSNLMTSCNLKSGRARVVSLIKKVIDQ